MSHTAMKKTTNPEWVKKGQRVGWTGQEGFCSGAIVRITEPQDGNYVLWVGSEDDLFPINAKSVERIEVNRGFGKFNISSLSADEFVTASGLNDGGWVVWRNLRD